MVNGDWASVAIVNGEWLSGKMLNGDWALGRTVSSDWLSAVHTGRVSCELSLSAHIKQQL